MGKRKQTLKSGTICRFNFEDLLHELFEEIGKDSGFYDEDSMSKALEGKKCIIINLATFTELGDKDFEYYDVIFKRPNILDGQTNYTILIAISGYHLEKLK